MGDKLRKFKQDRQQEKQPFRPRRDKCAYKDVDEDEDMTLHLSFNDRYPSKEEKEDETHSS